MQQQRGFTLIELIIVIVILGILAVTAAPKFIDIQKDAKAATVQAVQGAVNSVTTVAHGKALIQSQTAETGTVTINGDSFATTYAYLANSVDLTDLLDIDPAMLPVFEQGTTGAGAVAVPAIGTSVLTFYGYDDTLFNYLTKPAGTGCLIIYTAATANAPATVETFTGDCV